MQSTRSSTAPHDRTYSYDEGGVATPDKLETRLGTLTSVDGVSDEATAQKIYDNQTRSMLQTDQRFPGIDSMKKDLQKNPDGSVDVYLGPTAPEGEESNWIQAVPGKGWNSLLRLYGPLAPWFDKTWMPGDFEL